MIVALLVLLAQAASPADGASAPPASWYQFYLHHPVERRAELIACSQPNPRPTATSDPSSVAIVQRCVAARRAAQRAAALLGTGSSH